MFKPTEDEIFNFIRVHKRLHPGLDRAQAIKYMRNRYDAVENTKAMHKEHIERLTRMARTPADYAMPARQVFVGHSTATCIGHAALWFGVGLMIGGVL
ncbi:MAG: hypothetical protein ACOYBW_08785 [Fluviibacter phosphoraccumulans]